MQSLISCDDQWAKVVQLDVHWQHCTQLLGLPARFSSSSNIRSSLNWLHHTKTCLCEISFSPYASTTTIWISVGDFYFAFINWITARTSTLDGFSIKGILKTDWHNLKIQSNNEQPLPPWEEVSKAYTEIWVRSSHVHSCGSTSVPYFLNFPHMSSYLSLTNPDVRHLYTDSYFELVVQWLGLAVANEPSRFGPLPHLKAERDPLSETFLNIGWWTVSKNYNPNYCMPPSECCRIQLNPQCLRSEQCLHPSSCGPCGGNWLYCLF
jgi:hypothetical protein